MKHIDFAILCIDSQIGILKALKETIQIKGYRVDILQANNIDEAMLKIKTGKYNLVFFQFAPYSLDLLKSIKEYNKNIQVVVYGSVVPEDALANSILFGAMEYLRMPWLPREIYGLIDRAIKICEKSEPKSSP